MSLFTVNLQKIQNLQRTYTSEKTQVQPQILGSHVSITENQLLYFFLNAVSGQHFFLKIYFILLEKLERGLETEGENERQRQK